MCTSESPNVLLAIFFYQEKVNTKAREYHEVLRKLQNRIAEYQGHKTALESMDQFEVRVRLHLTSI